MVAVLALPRAPLRAGMAVLRTFYLRNIKLSILDLPKMGKDLISQQGEGRDDGWNVLVRRGVEPDADSMRIDS